MLLLQLLDLEKFAQRRLEEPYPYVILDARYEKVREDGAVRSQAVLVAIGINREGRRNILAVEPAHRESLSSWRELPVSPRQRSLQGFEFVVSDDHAGLRRAIQEVLPKAVWQTETSYPYFKIILRMKVRRRHRRSSATKKVRSKLVSTVKI